MHSSTVFFEVHLQTAVEWIALYSNERRSRLHCFCGCVARYQTMERMGGKGLGWIVGGGGRGGDWLTTLKMLVELENYSIKCITGETWIGNQTELHTERRAGGG